MTYPRNATPFAKIEARVYADGRGESESCQAGTPGCSIDHTAERAAGRRDSSCDTW